MSKLDPLTERVLSVIAKSQTLQPDLIDPDMGFEQLGLDSLDSVNILFAIEEAFDVSIPDEEARKLSTVRQVVDYLRPLLSQRG